MRYDEIGRHVREHFAASLQRLEAGVAETGLDALRAAPGLEEADAEDWAGVIHPEGAAGVLRAFCAERGIAAGDLIRDIMLEGVERRFGTYRASSVIEMLSDNGSPYISRDTQIFARQFRLKPCFTPVQRPQSNGISEAFAKTLKRDYVQVTPLPDAQDALRLIGGWIEDYNDNHPHSGLKMRSPREFITAQTATALSVR